MPRRTHISHRKQGKKERERKRMADNDNDEVNSQDQQQEEDDVWEEPVEDVDALEDGPRTIIVGGCSRVDSVDDALERYRGPGDRILIMPGVYETGLILDSGKYPRLQISGAFPPPTLEEERAAREKKRYQEEHAEEIADAEANNRWLPPLVFGPERAPVVIFKGKLSAQYQESTAVSYDEDEENSGGKLAVGATRRLTVSNICFQGGASITEETDLALEHCTFGIPFLPPAEIGKKADDNKDDDDAVLEQRTVRVHALSTADFKRCRIYGAERSALYCYPIAKATFNNCEFVGMVPTPANAVSASTSPTPDSGAARSPSRIKQAAPAPQAPATAAPASCISDAGIHLDDAGCTFSQCSVRNFNLGVVTNDPCQGSKLLECAVSEIASVGLLLGASSKLQLRECKARLCGREAVVVGPRSHVSMRDCAFNGDVRLKDGAVLTALVDNVVGPEASKWNVISEAKVFSDRGFRQVEDDPTARKKRKPPPAEDQ